MNTEQPYGSIEPSQPYGSGHRRSPESTEELIRALSATLRENPSYRLGQLLLVLVDDPADIWTIWDEVWVDKLREFNG